MPFLLSEMKAEKYKEHDHQKVRCQCQTSLHDRKVKSVYWQETKFSMSKVKPSDRD